MGNKKLRVALFGIEQHLGGVLSDIETSQYTIHCVPKISTEELSDFNAAIVFQGAFEDFHQVFSGLTTSYWMSSDTDELDRRYKELIRLCKNGGFVLFVLTRPFYDYYKGNSYKDTDLPKRFCNNLIRHDLSSPDPNVISKKAELSTFCEKYGRAYSHVEEYGYQDDDRADFRPLVVDHEERVVGFLLFRKIYFLSTLVPKNCDWGDFLRELTDSVLSLNKKVSVELPKWVNDFLLDGEAALVEEIASCEERIRLAQDKVTSLSVLKRVLVESGEELVKSVSLLTAEITGLAIDFEDNKREDCRIIDGSGNIVALVEVKGLNGNIKISNVSQAFEHRERSSGYEKLPVILIANTFIATARSVEEKDKPPEEEQIALAKKHKVLILRTLDLLRMFNAVSSGRYTKEEIVRSLLTKVGWWHFERECEASASEQI